MRVLVSLEHRFLRSPDGTVWTQVAYAYDFWRRYLAVFDEVCVVARVQSVELPPDGHVPANGPGVLFSPVPYYVGPYQYLRQRSSVHRTLHHALQRDAAVIMRVASQLANCLFAQFRRENRPYGLEVVGDPWDMFAPGVVRHPFRFWFRQYFTRQLRNQCKRATGAAYVTEQALQSRYPVADSALSTSYSSVELPDGAFRRPLSSSFDDVSDRRYELADTAVSGHPFRLLFVGTLEQLYKAPDVLLNAVARGVGMGLNLHLTLLGDGQYRHFLEQQANRLEIRERVEFLGQVSGSVVRQKLDHSDIFVLPSHTEGLPRALIEAMARGLPCIASAVNGIPELLSAEDLVPPGDAEALAARIREIVLAPNRRRQMAVRNFERALDFHSDVLRARRTNFYRHLRERTQVWLERGEAA